jgi:hypothetical protein
MSVGNGIFNHVNGIFPCRALTLPAVEALDDQVHSREHVGVMCRGSTGHSREWQGHSRDQDFFGLLLSNASRFLCVGRRGIIECSMRPTKDRR